jgi:fructose-1,6-bisphosphatase/inositol monophosphatase family enzyme
MIDVGLRVWDATPLVVILGEAGGGLTDWSGQLVAREGNALAANDAMARILPSFLRTGSS